MKIKEKIEALSKSNELICCHDFSLACSNIDMELIQKSERYTMELAVHDVDVVGEPGYSVEDGVATIKIRGLLVPDLGVDAQSFGITGYDIIGKYLDNANADGSVDSIILDINSPGGVAQGMTVAGRNIKKSKKKTKTYAHGIVASGAYWLASQSDSIVADDDVYVGSIGVRKDRFDYSRQLENEGVRITTFTSGKYKAEGSSIDPITQEEAERIQLEVDEIAQKFFETVSAGRGIPVDTIRSWEADTFNASKSLELGLIDEIGEVMTKKSGVASTASDSQVNAPDNQATQAAITAAVNEALAAQREALAAEMKEQQAKIHAEYERRDIVKNAAIKDDMKSLLIGEAFASVDNKALKSLIEAMPASHNTALDAHGGAGITEDASSFDISTVKYGDSTEASAEFQNKRSII